MAEAAQLYRRFRFLDMELQQAIETNKADMIF